MKNLFFLALSFLILSSCSEESGSQLALNLETDKDYKQSTSVEATIVQEFGGEEIEIVMTINGGINYHVVAANEDGYDLEVKYDSIGMKMELPMGTMDFNSEKDDINDMFSRILGSMRNKPFNIKVGNDGKIAEVTNIDRLFESVFAEFPDLDPMQIDQLKSQLMESYGPDAFKGNMEMAMAIFPDKPVGVGDSWDIENELNSASLNADITTTYTLKEVKDGNYILNGESKISTNENGEVEVDGTKMTYDLDGEMNSEIIVDGKSGWILEANVIQEIKGTTIMAPNAEMPEGLTMPINMKNKMVVKGS